MTQWRRMEEAMARMRYGFTNGVMVSSELSSEMALSALSISITTRTERESVEALTLPLVKYSHGAADKSIPSTKLFTLKSFHSGHCDQVLSYSKVTSVWPSPVSAIVYHQTKMPTVARPTYIPMTM